MADETKETETPASPDPAPAKVEGDPLIDAEPSEPSESSEEAAEEAGRAGDHPRDQYLELAQRTKAEFENYRKRAVRERSEAEGRGAAKLAKELLPALDNLHRALEASASDGNDSEALITGLDLVQKDMLAALSRAGIEPYSPEGEAFDPNAHEAMAQQPVEGAETGTIVEVYQRGFRHGETVLRPARVVVAA